MGTVFTSRESCTRRSPRLQAKLRSSKTRLWRLILIALTRSKAESRTGNKCSTGRKCSTANRCSMGRKRLAPPAEGPGLFTGPFNQVPLPGSVPGGGGAFNPGEQLVTVCVNGIQRSVPESQLSAFLSAHPSASAGSCQPTPTQFASVCVNGIQRSVPESQLSAFLSAHPGASAGSCQPTPTQFASVCDNGTQRSVLRSRLAAFLAAHPGDFVGSCQPTPTTNR